MVGRTLTTSDDITEDDKLKFLMGIKFSNKEDAGKNQLLAKNNAIKQCNSFQHRGLKAQQLLMAGNHQQDDK